MATDTFEETSSHFAEPAMATASSDINRIEVDNKRLYMKNVYYWSSKYASWFCVALL